MKPDRPSNRGVSFVLRLLSLMFFSAVSATAESPSPGSQVEMKLEVADVGEIPYLLYLPKNYEDKAEWPLILFLHGRGESYGPLRLVQKWGPPRMAARGDDFPYVLVSPQCPEDDRWTSEIQQQLLVALLDSSLKSHRIDENRVYLTGLSMGGYGSWRLAADHPERFAAVVPICGRGDANDAGVLKDLPIWVFHGDQDGDVPFAASEKMVAAIREAKGTKIKFTSLEGVGHNSWSPAYALPELYAWLNKQVREPQAE